MATVCGDTPAGSIVAIQENGAGFSRRSTVRRMATATPKHLVPVGVGVARNLNLKLETVAFW